MAETYINLGVLLYQSGRSTEAEQAYRQALVQQERAHNPRRCSMILNNLRTVLSDNGKLAEAEKAYRDGLAILEKANTEESISPGALTLSIHNNLCGVLMKLGRYEEAEKGFRTAIAIGAKLAADHSNVPEYQHKLAVGHGNLGLALLWTERLPEAEAACRQAAGMFEKLANSFRLYQAPFPTWINDWQAGTRVIGKRADSTRPRSKPSGVSVSRRGWWQIFQTWSFATPLSAMHTAAWEWCNIAALIGRPRQSHLRSQTNCTTKVQTSLSRSSWQ